MAILLIHFRHARESFKKTRKLDYGSDKLNHNKNKPYHNTKLHGRSCEGDYCKLYLRISLQVDVIFSRIRHKKASFVNLRH